MFSGFSTLTFKRDSIISTVLYTLIKFCTIVSIVMQFKSTVVRVTFVLRIICLIRKGSTLNNYGISGLYCTIKSVWPFQVVNDFIQLLMKILTHSLRLILFIFKESLGLWDSTVCLLKLETVCCYCNH